MKRAIVFLAAIAFCTACSAVVAEYVIYDRGTWPKSWPKELEPLRKQARTFDGSVPGDLHYVIPFTKREDFESSWPHLLKVKSKGAPIILVRGPRTDFFNVGPAGVVIQSPLSGTYIELVVDGKIVDLNRIPLPADTSIIDERFKDGKNK
ncbi:MAG TPA: hypothetical protein VKE98_18095 [Gemmataceae bacterium]|nr:hypothetical protein [Gemmataceae bacterium]